MKVKFYILSFLSVAIIIFSATNSINGQVKNICDCWKLDEKKVNSETIDCSDVKLSDLETIQVMECLIKQKGNKKPIWGVALSNEVSQTFGPSPLEIVALFKMSELFYGNNNFALAMVLRNDKNEELNSRKTVKKAFSLYEKWFKKIKEIGLAEVRKQKIDPLADSHIRWY